MGGAVVSAKADVLVHMVQNEPLDEEYLARRATRRQGQRNSRRALEAVIREGVQPERAGGRHSLSSIT